MKRKLIPPFLMLFAGAISGIIMFILQYETKKMLLILLGVLIGFYIIGSLFKLMLDVFDRQNSNRTADKDEAADGITTDGEEGQVNTEG